jgi:hypothetical protein
MEESVGLATAGQCVGMVRVRIAVDGSSVRVVDRSGGKRMGRIGTDANGARGLKVIRALAIHIAGAIIGLLGQVWWSRPGVGACESALGSDEADAGLSV